MESLWSSTVKRKRSSALEGDRETEVLVIGGGMAGVLCAHFLQERGVDCLLAEAGRIGDGVTKNTTAKITAQHGLLYDKLIRTFGLEKAKQYLDANLRAVERYHSLCSGFDCDFEEMPSYIFTKGNEKKIEDEAKALNRLGYPAQIVREIPIPVFATSAIAFEKQAQFHPLKFLIHLAENLPILENTEVERIEGGVAFTAHGRIRAKKIIVATHFPCIKIQGFYFVKQYQQRSYVIALKGAEKLQGMFLDEAENGLSFRPYKDFLLLGGGGHRTGKQGGGWAELRSFAKKYYPRAKEVYHWATQDCMTLDGVPYIGRYAKTLPDVFVATGFNKWGMTSSMVAAEILSGMVLGETPAFAEVFSPQRSILHPKLFANLGESAVNLLTFKTPRCTHLGCALHYNKMEHSWDCACHGSRFTCEGIVINNPAVQPIKKGKRKPLP